jgi:hypothetical protein
MAFADLPARGECAAPTFDDQQPEGLGRYFVDLEVLLARNNVNAEAERKLAALKYLNIQTENLWKTTEGWLDPTKTYDEFKEEVTKLYPGTTGDRMYTIQELDTVVGHYAHIGIHNSSDLGKYYCRFLLILRFLIGKGRLSTQEQSQTFF